LALSSDGLQGLGISPAADSSQVSINGIADSHKRKPCFQ
jgi:hypothetical protein